MMHEIIDQLTIRNHCHTIVIVTIYAGVFLFDLIVRPTCQCIRHHPAILKWGVAGRALSGLQAGFFCSEKQGSEMPEAHWSIIKSTVELNLTIVQAACLLPRPWWTRRRCCKPQLRREESEQGCKQGCVHQHLLWYFRILFFRSQSLMHIVFLKRGRQEWKESAYKGAEV